MLPSEIKLDSCYGYRHEVFTGWRKLNEAIINGEGYSVEFFRLSESTIDALNDALNGWFNIWTKFRCEYRDSKGRLSITVRKPEDADKLFNMLVDIQPIEFEHEGTTPAVAVARTKMETLIDLIRKDKNDLQSKNSANYSNS